MKTLLPFVFFLLLPFLATGQKTADPGQHEAPSQRFDAPRSALAKALIDTILPAALSDTCARSAMAFGITDIDGFVTGSNGYGDLVKLQRFSFNADGPFAITSVGVAFAGYDTTIEETFLQALVFDDLQPDSSFGDFLGVSDSVQVRNIALPTTQIEFTFFDFPEPVIVERDSFLVGVDFSDTYNATENGYVGIYHTRQDCGDGRNTFEFFPTQGGGLGFATLFDNWGGLNIEMFMVVVIDTEVSTATRHPLADYGASVSPNPASSLAAVTFRTELPGTYAATLTDLTGRQLRQSRLNTPAGPSARIEWQVGDLPAGLYLYHIDGPAGRQSGKVMVQ
ncbi:hypothetical protein GGR26_001254 [Lewinella marina]|nr:T9SS type A sorting domain-containing protein [Neolewinella marina]NJB85509.1 hypothetical protein [Neolewinella marina]